MVGEEFLSAHLSSQRGFALPCVVSFECGLLEEEEGEFDLGFRVVVAAWSARCRA